MTGYEELNQSFDEMAATALRIRNERDELLVALKACVTDLQVVQDEICEMSPALANAKATIAKVEASQ